MEIIINLPDTGENTYDVYTDGSYYGGEYSYAYAFIKNNEVIYEDSGVGTDYAAAKMRNVAGELEAVERAVKFADKINAKISIFHDYSGISKWVNGSWQAKNKFTRAYVKFMKSHHNYRLIKVAGHSGNKFNDYVDKLAKEALGI